MLNWRKFLEKVALEWFEWVELSSEVLKGIKCYVESYWGKKIPKFRSIRYVVLLKIDLISPAFENIITIHQSSKRVINWAFSHYDKQHN